eukprot:119949-Chlamydomonas_euryale.AAC.1
MFALRTIGEMASPFSPLPPPCRVSPHTNADGLSGAATRAAAPPVAREVREIWGRKCGREWKGKGRTTMQQVHMTARDVAQCAGTG